MTFFTSPQFLWSSVGLTFILVVVAVLVRGAAGGSKEVASRQGRMWLDIFLKSLVVRWMIAAAIAGVIVGESGILSHLSGVSAALSPSRVFRGEVESDSRTNQKCNPYSPDTTNFCVLTEKWSAPIGVDRRTRAGEYTFCYSYTPSTGKIEHRKVGINIFQLRSAHGNLSFWYRMIKGSSVTCPTLG